MFLLFFGFLFPAAISYNLSVKYLSDQMSRDRLLKNSWSYSRAGLTKGVPNGLSVTRRDELAVSDVGLAGYGNEIFECYYFGIVSYFYFLPYICQRLTWAYVYYIG